MLADIDAACALAPAPVLLTGDFNEPSELDWTAAARSLHTHVVRWPATRRLAARLVDAVRAVHPDPLAQPLASWTTAPAAREKHDRIDFVFVSPQLGVVDAALVGPCAPARVRVTPYPSDHHAVLAVLSGL